MAIQLSVNNNYLQAINLDDNSNLFFKPKLNAVGQVKDGSCVLSYPPMHSCYRRFNVADMEDDGGTPFTESTLLAFLHVNTGV